MAPHEPCQFGSMWKNALLEFWLFGLKQAWACLFAGVLLGLILLTSLVWPDNAMLARYDFLFLAALSIQAALLICRMESWEEARIILIFHTVGTVMEIFKTHMGSWSYPEENFIRLGGVPLFSGFMYSAVGSYMVRIWHLLEFRFSNYPPLWATGVLCIAIYVNFFTHHFGPDVRMALFGVAALLFGRCQIYFTPDKARMRMPLLIGFTLVAFFIWVAENLGTFGGVWVYPDQTGGWRMVSFAKMGSWWLLMLISFVLVTTIHRPKPEPLRARLWQKSRAHGPSPIHRPPTNPRPAHSQPLSESGARRVRTILSDHRQR